MLKNKLLGNQGEDFSAKWLQKKGYEIIGQNIHSQAGEIDILTYDRKKKIYVAFEIKTRKNESFGSGIESVTVQKIEKIEKTLIDYFLKSDLFSEIPDYEIQALILKPNPKKGWREPVFLVEHYKDLS